MRAAVTFFAFLLAGVLLLSACGSDGDDSAQVTAITEAPTTTVVDPYAVPSVIDAAYVERILNAHVQVRDVVSRNVSSHREFSADDRARINSLYTGDALEFQLGVFDRAAAEPRTSTNEIPSTVTNAEIRRAYSNCIWVEANGNGSGGSTRFGFVLVTAEKSALNDTGWKQSHFTLPDQLNASNAC